MVRDKISAVQKDLNEGRKTDSQKTIFHELITSDQLRPEEKTADRLEAEGVGVVGAG